VRKTLLEIPIPLDFHLAYLNLYPDALQSTHTKLGSTEKKLRFPYPTEEHSPGGAANADRTFSQDQKFSVTFA
jgi:hypothetical protein